MRISAVILAGGKGERLFPLTNTRPKPLCPVGGVYPLERAIELAREAGAGEIIVTAGYMASSIEAYTRGMENVTTLREEKPLSTAGAVRNARPSGDIIIVLCGDTLCGFSLLPAVKAQMNGDCDATIVTTRSKAPTEYGIVTVTDGRVTGFLEKPSWNGVTGDEVNTGIYILRRRVLELIPPETPYDFGGELFPKMVADGKPVAVFRADVHILQIQAAAVAVGYRLIADADALPLLQLLILADEHLEGVIGYIGVTITPIGIAVGGIGADLHHLAGAGSPGHP